MKNIETKEVIREFIISIAYTAGFAILDGLVTATLWNWFVVRLGAPRMTLPISIGICAMVGLVVWEYHETPGAFYPKKAFEEMLPITLEYAARHRRVHLVVAITVLVIGFIAHLFL